MFRALLAVCCFTSVLGLGPAQAQALQVPVHRTSAEPLAVPYLRQTELLCGGAALAMVERWWGKRGVYAEDFEDLVQPSLGGIRTIDLSTRSSSRGWQTTILKGDREAIQQALQRGIPAIALIEVAPNRYHYVVVIAWDSGGVMLHDPANAPSITMSEERFLTRWHGADGWAMIVRPAMTTTLPPSNASASIPAPIESLPCRPWLDSAVAATADNRLTEAKVQLDAAASACPGEALILRERAAMEFKAGNHTAVITLLTEYLPGAPEDYLAWQLLGTSRYLTGDSEGALTAWNHLDRPQVDIVSVAGIERIRFLAISDAISIPHGTTLSGNDLALARRRLGEVPALVRSQIDYQPLPGGLSEVTANILVRPTIDPLWRLAGENAVRAVSQHQIGFSLATPTGAGELWSASWRWEPARPRVALKAEFPVRLGLPGLLTIGAVHERFRFAVDSAVNGVVEQSRHVASVGFQSWITSAIRPSLSLQLERWPENEKYLTLDFTTDIHIQRDHFLLRANGGLATAMGNQQSYTRLGLRGMWASSLSLDHTMLSSRLGLDWVSTRAPLATWPQVSGGSPSTIPLRAHTLREDALLRGEQAGPQILHAGVAVDQPVYRVGLVVVGVGAFLDAANVSHPANGKSVRTTFLDGGVGIRLGLAGGSPGVLRVDFARSLLVDRRQAVTAGVHLSWPFFE